VPRSSKRNGRRDPAAVLASLEEHFRKFLEEVGAFKNNSPELDIEGTPARVAKMYARELLASYQEGAREEFLGTLKSFKLTKEPEMVVVRKIPFNSLCAHHLLPFHGEAHIGYVPTTHLAGLSKFVRIVNYHAAKLQTQESMTSDIAQEIEDFLKPAGVGVRLSAVHLCMSCRGVRVAGSDTLTTALRGVFKEPNVKQEFYSQLPILLFRG